MEDQQNYYQPMASVPKQTLDDSPRQYWMLAAALVIGVVFDRLIAVGLFASDTHVQFTLCYGGFWLCYLTLYYALYWNQLRSNKDAWFLAVAAVLLLLRGLLYAQQQMLLFNVLAVPLLLMLHAVVARFHFAHGQEHRYGIEYLKGWLLWPFCALGRVFGVLGSLVRRRGTQARQAKYILAGVCIALPLMLLVSTLLLQADAVLAQALSGFWERLKIGNLLLHLLLVLTCAMLFSSFLFQAAPGVPQPPASQHSSRLPAVTLCVIVGGLLAVYAVFAAVQFTYLTGFKGLPSNLTYSEYARRGFSELTWVFCINLGLFALCQKASASFRALCGLLWGLLSASLVVLASAMWRLWMYIQAYGLTLARILPFWFMCFLAVTLPLCAWKLLRPATPLLRYTAVVFILWYVTLNFVNLDGLIAKSILSRAEAIGTLSQQDANYVKYILSSDAAPVLKEYRDLLKLEADG